MNESAKNDGYDVSDYDFVPGTDDANSYDWQDAVFRRAPVSNAQLALSGGVDRFRYYASGGNFSQRGIVIGSAYQRQSGRVNLDLSATNKLLLTTSMGLTREADSRIPGDQSLDGVVTNAIGLQPMRPIYGNSFGFGGTPDGLKYSNPVAIATYNFDSFKTLRALGNFQALYHATDSFTLNGRVGGDVYGVDELAWSSPKVDKSYAASANGVGRTDHTTASKYMLEGYLGYDVLKNDRSSLSRHRWIERRVESLGRSNYLRGEGFPNGFSTYVRNAATITTWDGSASDNNLVSFFSRANYSFRDRYLLSASLRADGSSRFGASNRYGTFPAISAGWVVTDESFAQKPAALRHAQAAWKLRHDRQSGHRRLRAPHAGDGHAVQRRRGRFGYAARQPQSQVGEHEGVRLRRRHLDARRTGRHHRRLLPPQHRQPAGAAPDSVHERLLVRVGQHRRHPQQRRRPLGLHTRQRSVEALHVELRPQRDVQPQRSHGALRRTADHLHGEQPRDVDRRRQQADRRVLHVQVPPRRSGDG